MLKGTAFHALSQRKDSETELVTANADGTIMFWDADETAPVIVWQHPSKERIVCVKVSPSGRYLATASEDNDIRIFDISSGLEVGLLKGHSAAVHTLEYSAGGETLASGGGDGREHFIIFFFSIFFLMNFRPKPLKTNSGKCPGHF